VSDKDEGEGAQGTKPHAVRSPEAQRLARIMHSSFASLQHLFEVVEVEGEGEVEGQSVKN
jgi:hypothetical protein